VIEAGATPETGGGRSNIRGEVLESFWASWVFGSFGFGARNSFRREERC
jgi:hypothetical protein